MLAMGSCYKCRKREATNGGLCQPCSRGQLGGSALRGQKPVPEFPDYREVHLEPHPPMSQAVILDSDLAVLSYPHFIGRFQRADRDDAEAYFQRLIQSIARKRLRGAGLEEVPAISFPEFSDAMERWIGGLQLDSRSHVPAHPTLVQILRKAFALKGAYFDPADLDHLQHRTLAYLIELYLRLITDPDTAEELREILELDPEYLEVIGRAPTLLVPLRDYQREFYRAWRKGPDEGILEMATATGKTVIGLRAISDITWEQDGQAKFLVAAHSHAILQQWRGEIQDKLGVDPGKVNTSTEGRMIELWTVQTLAKRQPETTYDLAIFDEVHHLAGAHWRNAFQVDADRKLGLSATVDEGQRLSTLRRELGPVAKTLSVGEALDQGILPDFDWHIHPVELAPDEAEEFQEQSEAIRDAFLNLKSSRETRKVLRKVKRKTDGRFDRTELEDLHDFVTAYGWANRRNIEHPGSWNQLFGMIQGRRWIAHRSQPKLASALRLIKEVVDHRKCMITTMDIETAESIGGALPPELTHVVHSKIKREEVFDRIEAFKEADAGALIAPKLLDEGIDVPDADIGFNVAGSKSRIQLIQRLGRILRPQPDKDPEFHHFVTLPPKEEYLEGLDDEAYVDDLLWVRELGEAIDVEPQFASPQMEAEFVERARRSGYRAKAKQLRQDDQTASIELPMGSVRFDQILDQIPEDAQEALREEIRRDPGNWGDEDWRRILERVRERDHSLPQGVWWLYARFSQSPDELVERLA